MIRSAAVSARRISLFNLTLGLVRPKSKVELSVENLCQPLSLRKLNKLATRLSAEHKQGIATPFYTRKGALVEFKPELPVVVVGDLHGNESRLNWLLHKFGPRLANKEISLVFLGDLVHHEKAENVTEFSSSARVKHTLLRLMYLYPEQVHVIQGNHDGIPENGVEGVRKKDTKGEEIEQGHLFRDFLQQDLQAKGFSQGKSSLMIEAYRRIVNRYPLAAIIEGRQAATYMAHSAVVEGGLSRSQLVRARSDWPLRCQLLSNRPIGLYPNGDYSASDVEATISGLNLSVPSENVVVLSGHSKDGKNWSIAPFRDESRHWIIHANIPDSFGYVIVRNGVSSFVPVETTQDITTYY